MYEENKITFDKFFLDWFLDNDIELGCSGEILILLRNIYKSKEFSKKLKELTCWNSKCLSCDLILTENFVIDKKLEYNCVKLEIRYDYTEKANMIKSIYFIKDTI